MRILQFRRTPQVESREDVKRSRKTGLILPAVKALEKQSQIHFSLISEKLGLGERSGTRSLLRASPAFLTEPLNPLLRNSTLWF